MSIDLHIHSNHSDGTSTPEEIVVMAKRKDLRAVSITDHDTATATKIALEMGKMHNIEIVPGIEMSSRHEAGSLHILGYYIESEDRELHRRLEVVQEARKERNRKIVRKLQEIGIAITYRDIVNESVKGQAGRPHIARVLVRKGYVRNMSEAFDQYLKKNAKAYVERFLYTSRESIEIIRASGGIAVLAHPNQIGLADGEMERLVGELTAVGLGGIETYYPTQSKSYRKKMKHLAKRYDLAITGGSDYHGNIRQGTDIGGGVRLQIPDDLLDKLKQKRIK